jgi:hypothetical protein
MTYLRQIEANRRNARLSTGPVTQEGEMRSRQNALRLRCLRDGRVSAADTFNVHSDKSDRTVPVELQRLFVLSERGFALSPASTGKRCHLRIATWKNETAR